MVNTLLLFSLSPYSQTERQTKKRIHSLRMGWRNLFSSCAVVSVFGSGGKYVLVLHTATYVLTVQYSCGVVLVFWFWWEIVFGVTYVLSVQYSCAVVLVFLLWRESYFNTNFLVKSENFLKFKSLPKTLLILQQLLEKY